MAWYQKAVESDGSAFSYRNLGRFYDRQGQYDKAIENLDKAIEIDPEDARAYNLKAWILATCPKKKYRDGDKAVDLAKKAVELSLSSTYLDTLAAAYAEASRFEDAITTQAEAISILEKEEKPDEEINEFKERLMAYQAIKPWRED